MSVLFLLVKWGPSLSALTSLSLREESHANGHHHVQINLHLQLSFHLREISSNTQVSAVYTHCSRGSTMKFELSWALALMLLHVTLQRDGGILCVFCVSTANEKLFSTGV